MIELEYSKLFNLTELTAIGSWLEENMPNPPLPDEQRWTIGHTDDGTARVGIRFASEVDATLFMLRWS